MITIAIIACSILLILGFLYWLIAPNGPQTHEWGVCKTKGFNLWYVYCDGRELREVCGITKWGTCFTARKYALKERHGWSTPVTTDINEIKVIKQKNAFTDAEKDAYIAKLEHDLNIK